MTSGPPPALTIYTDASFAQNTRAGSWGAMIRQGETEHTFAGAFKESCADSTAAEIQAIANALQAAHLAGLLIPGRWAEVITDCQAAAQVLQGKGKAKFRQRHVHLHERTNLIRTMIKARGWRVTFRWIAGHQSATSSCPDVQGNRAADKLARDAHPGLAARREHKRLARQRRKAREKALRQANQPGRLAHAHASAPAREEPAPAAPMDKITAHCARLCAEAQQVQW